MPIADPWASDPEAEIPMDYRGWVHKYGDLIASGGITQGAFRVATGAGSHVTKNLFTAVLARRPQPARTLPDIAPAPEAAPQPLPAHLAPTAPTVAVEDVIREVAPKPRGRVHIPIGDAHAKPGQPLHRFRWLGRMIRDIAPDVVVDIGDSGDMRSLSSYDTGKAAAENRRYVDDVDALDRAIDLVHEEAGDVLMAAERYRCVGNHEERIDRYANDHPELVGLLDSTTAFETFHRHAWHVSPFLVPVAVDGVHYSHFFCSQNTNRPIGGVNAARSLVLKLHTSVVVGHSHKLQHHREVARDGRALNGLVCGWYGGAVPKYAHTSEPGWWCGINILRDVRDGDYDLESWSIGRISREWGTVKERAEFGIPRLVA